VSASDVKDRAARPAGQVGPILTFHHPSGEPVTWGEFDPVFLKALGIGPSSWDQPVRVELVAQQSKRGNTFFSYEQGGIPLPDGFETGLCLEDVRLQADQVGQSKRGNPTRRYHGALVIDGIPYDAVGYVTKSSSPYWVTVHLHVQKLANRRESALQPRGGRFV